MSIHGGMSVPGQDFLNVPKHACLNEHVCMGYVDVRQCFGVDASNSESEVKISNVRVVPMWIHRALFFLQRLLKSVWILGSDCCFLHGIRQGYPLNLSI